MDEKQIKKSFAQDRDILQILEMVKKWKLSYHAKRNHGANSIAFYWKYKKWHVIFLKGWRIMRSISIKKIQRFLRNVFLRNKMAAKKLS